MAIPPSLPQVAAATAACCWAMLIAFGAVSWLKRRAAAKAIAHAAIDARLKGLYRTVELRGPTPDLTGVLDRLEAPEGGRTP
jgi:uncharacterized iron-regulated membrane protein